MAPLLDREGRMLWQWPTEDGYLMMTIARNIALGKGMTVSDGEIQTNGTQPLATLLWAGIFWLAEGDRSRGVMLIQLAQAAFGAMGALFLFMLGRRLLGDKPWGHSASAFAAALWFSSPVVINHTMNGLETGLYLALVVLSLLAWTSWRAQPLQHLRFRGGVAVGTLLGITFLARIDAVFLIAALTGWHSLLALKGGRRDFLMRTSESCVVGLTSIAVASPWLAYCYIMFGNVMPISGTAQAVSATIGANATRIPLALFGYASQIAPIPLSLADQPAVVLPVTAACLAVFAVLLRGVRTVSPEARAAALAGGTFGVALALYYGLFFGAKHFVARYMAPWSPLLALTSSALLLAALNESNRGARRWVRLAAQIVILGLSLGLNARIYANTGRGSAWEHVQVLRWVQANVQATTWLGAVQTGVLGFFHERTINLDGKVNPYALAAVLERRIPNYVVQTPIEYIADWQGIARWIEYPPIEQHFELLVSDHAANLAVLRRLTPLSPSANVRGYP